MQNTTHADDGCSMSRNIEIKARIVDRDAFEARVQRLAGAPAAVIEQDDCFFACTTGRLKLRDFGDGHGELIAYERPDQPGPTTSSYARTETRDPDGLREALTRSLGAVGRVRKSRTLYLTGRTRIHLDRVDGLGDYMELEVVLSEGEARASGEQEAEQLMAELAIASDTLCHGAYVDLLAAAGRR